MSISDLLSQVDFLPYRYVIEHGQVVACRAEQLGGKRAGGCHGNAKQLAGRWPQRYTWWTGYAVVDGLPIAHSWVERDGEHIEVTWSEPGVAYIGVPVIGISAVRAIEGSGHPIENIAWSVHRDA